MSAGSASLISFTSSGVVFISGSTPRRRASWRKSSGTGSRPWAPVPIQSFFVPHGTLSAGVRSVWPNSYRRHFEGPFFLFWIVPPSITMSCS